MTYIPENIAQWAFSRQTSGEIALAIFERAAEGDEDRMWQDPTDAETTAVVELAWSYAHEDEDCLNWGCERIRR